VKNAHEIIIQPYITEKSAAMSYGDERQAQRLLINQTRAANKNVAAGKKKEEVPRVTEEDLVRKYTFLVARTANKIEIKHAIEEIYNAGKKKKDELIEVTNVRTLTIKGKRKRNRINARSEGGYTPNRKKAIVTLAKGQMLEDYGV
jgi:large subunit ribosomal protein L23